MMHHAPDDPGCMCPACYRDRHHPGPDPARKRPCRQCRTSVPAPALVGGLCDGCQDQTALF